MISLRFAPGRATPALLDRLHVEAYGSTVPLKQIAGVTVPDARTLVITAFDRGTVSAIKKAVENQRSRPYSQRGRLQYPPGYTCAYRRSA